MANLKHLSLKIPYAHEFLTLNNPYLHLYYIVTIKVSKVNLA